MSKKKKDVWVCLTCHRLPVVSTLSQMSTNLYTVSCEFCQIHCVLHSFPNNSLTGFVVQIITHQRYKALKTTLCFATVLSLFTATSKEVLVISTLGEGLTPTETGSNDTHVSLNVHTNLPLLEEGAGPVLAPAAVLEPCTEALPPGVKEALWVLPGVWGVWGVWGVCAVVGGVGAEVGVARSGVDRRCLSPLSGVAPPSAAWETGRLSMILCVDSHEAV